MKYKLIPTILVALFLYSCSNDEVFTLGENLIDSDLKIIQTDTITVNLSTIMIDSLASSATSTALVGHYKDDEFGITNCQTYFQLSSPSYSAFDENEVFDSICVTLNYNGYYLGDTTTSITLSVHEVTEDIEPSDDDYIYNNSSFSYNANPLGTFSFTPRPNSNKTVSFRITDELGETFFEKIKNNDADYNTSSKFIETFKGITIKSVEAETNAIISFSAADTCVMIRMYTHTIKNEKIEITHDFLVSDEDLQFNSITGNYSNTLLSSLKSHEDKLEASTTNNMAYLQGGTGLLTRIDFPYIRALIEKNDIYVLKATLIIVPEAQSFYSFKNTESTVLYYSNKHNQLNTLFTDSDNSTVNGTIHTDLQYNENNYIAFDLTSIFQTYIANNYVDEREGLILSFNPDTYISTVEPLKLLQSVGNKNNTRLILHLNQYE